MKKYSNVLPKRHVAIGACKYAVKKHYIEGHKLVWEMIGLIGIFALIMIVCAYWYDNKPVLLKIELCCVGAIVFFALCRFAFFALSPAYQHSDAEKIA